MKRMLALLLAVLLLGLLFSGCGGKDPESETQKLPTPSLEPAVPDGSNADPKTTQGTGQTPDNGTKGETDPAGTENGETVENSDPPVTEAPTEGGPEGLSEVDDYTVEIGGDVGVGGN